MKSGRQRRDEIRARRRVRSAIEQRTSYDPWEPQGIPRGALRADPAKLVHDGTYGPRPRFYVDTRFTCMDCGRHEVWTAFQQKWWYEEAKGKIDSRANRCRECRRKRRMRRSQDRRVHMEGLMTKYGVEETARRSGQSIDVLMRLREQWEKS
jgi:hypothetical protein